MQPAAPVSREKSFIRAIILFSFFSLDALNSAAEPTGLGTKQNRCTLWTQGWSSSSQQQHAAQMEMDSEKSNTFRKQNKKLSNSSKRFLSGEVSEKAADVWNGKQLRNRLAPPPSQPLHKPRRARTRQEAAVRSPSGDSKGSQTPCQASSAVGSEGGSAEEEETQAPLGSPQISKSKVASEPTIDNSGFSSHSVDSMLPPAKELASRLEKTTEALQRLREQTESVRPAGPTPTVDITETAMANHAKEQQTPVGLQERTSQKPAFKKMVAAYQELVHQENARSSLGRDPVAELTVHQLTSMFKSPSMFDGRAPREWLMQIERYHALVGMRKTVRV